MPEQYDVPNVFSVKAHISNNFAVNDLLTVRPCAILRDGIDKSDGIYYFSAIAQKNGGLNMPGIFSLFKNPFLAPIIRLLYL